MNIRTLLAANKTNFSFEFFPPKDKTASDQLLCSVSELIALQPAYVSVTYGAGGSTRQLTHDLVVRMQQETGITVVSHLTCVGSTQDEIKKILETYSISGIENVLALSGDAPKGQEQTYAPPPHGFSNAVELVTFIKKNFPHFGIGVAGFPEGHKRTPNRLTELDYLKAKVDAGADYICTQLFFDNHDFFDFCERCELIGITIPIIAGIMPITSHKGMQRMAELSPLTRFPARLQKALARAQDDSAVEKVGIHWATEQVLELIDHNVRGVHFYTLNRSKATREIYASLGVSNSTQLQS